VRDLFGAVPARRKFLRAESTESAHVAEAVTLLALARPATAFFLHSGGRAVLEAPAAQDLVEVDGGEEWARVSGFVSRAEAQRPPRPSLRLFVNHRPVRDRALAKAVSEAFRVAGAAARGFEAILFVDVPPEMVDVNVHPAKTEVRFADGRTAFVAVERAVRAALSEGGRQAPRADTRRVETAVQRYLEEAEGSPEGADRGAAETSRGGGASRVADRSEFARLDARESPGPAREDVRDLKVLGQHRNTYIVATDGEELLLVDQHTAHERVRYEQVLAALERRSREAQLLLTPVIFTLPPGLLPLLKAHAEALHALGYEVEGFGGGSVSLRSVPALLAGRDPGGALEALLRDFQERGTGEWMATGARDRLAATLACHSAVRAGQVLPGETMAAIARDLLRTAHPALCPHGRPTFVRIPREDLTRWFGRTGWRRQ
jgi:DNA mismatch repair protein MutL